MILQKYTYVVNSSGFKIQQAFSRLFHSLTNIDVKHTNSRRRHGDHRTVPSLAMVPQCIHALSAEQHHVTRCGILVNVNEVKRILFMAFNFGLTNFSYVKCVVCKVLIYNF